LTNRIELLAHFWLFAEPICSALTENIHTGEALGPLRVIRVGLTVREPPPVFADERTFAKPAGMFRSRQKPSGMAAFGARRTSKPQA
jgi:hypothetical protein